MLFSSSSVWAKEQFAPRVHLPSLWNSQNFVFCICVESAVFVREVRNRRRFFPPPGLLLRLRLLLLLRLPLLLLEAGRE